MLQGHETRSYQIVPAAPLTRRLADLSDVEWDAVRPHALPTGFRYLVTDEQEPVEPVLLYLHEKCVRSARIQSAGNTQRAFCDDLYEWFSYLATIGLRWDVVVTEDVEKYRDALLSAVSPATGRPYAISTVRRRLSTIVDFHAWAVRTGLVEQSVDSRSARKIPNDFARDALAHVHAGPAEIEVSDLLPRAYAEDQVDAFAIADLRRVFQQLGPLPGDEGDDRPCRDRIIPFLAFATGMRIDECVSLTVPQIEGLREDPVYGNYPLRITKTKGLRPRTVIIPKVVRDDLMAYISGERAAAVRASRSRAPTTALFVNARTATRNRGGPLKAHTVWRNFNRAVLAAGLTRMVTVLGEDGPEQRVEAAHSFHDLRHTFAVLMYFELVKAGKGEPWLALKNLLGHRRLTTTVNIYLRSVQTKEAVMSDALHAYLQGLRDA
jgi:site-specific recombinase XerD